MAILRLESGLKKSRPGGGEMAVSGCLLAAMIRAPKLSSIGDYARTSRRCGRVGKRYRSLV